VKIAGLLGDEQARLVALRAAGLLDTPAEAAFDDLTQLAATICGTPIALVSLVDEHRQWFKSSLGLDAAETPREVAFCAHAILEPGLFIVPDAHLDPRFADNPLVTEAPNVRFYAGAPLVVGGHPLGTLCVIDHAARELTPGQRAALAALARQVSAQIELRRTATELARANAQLDDLLAHSNDLVMTTTTGGRPVYVNRAWRETLGYTDAEATALSIDQLIAPESYEPSMALLARLLRGEELGRIETVFVRKDGQRVFLEGNAICRFERGVPIATRSIFHDVTERRHDQERLQRYADLVEAMEIGVWIWRKGDEADPRSYRLVAANRSIGRLLDIDLDGKLGLLAADVAPQVIAADAQRTWDEVRASGVARIRERFPFRHRTFTVNIFPLPDRCVGVAIEDVTHRLEVDRMKSEFISTVSHELRTPLTSIRGALGLLEANVLSPDEATETIQIARKNTERLVRLINDMLDLEKIEAGKLELRRGPISIAEVCDEALAGVRASAQDAAVTLALSVPTDLAPLIGDRDRLVQVLTNLVSNAIKFSPRGARVEIRAEAPARDRVRISVVDEGPGIAAAQLHKLFGKFQQLDSSDTRTMGGTGLGLAISKAIVEEHDGTIGVESSPGSGCTFWFELPRPRRARPESASRGGPRALLAEDDVSIREIMAKQLGTIGVELLEAGTGAEAVEIAGKTALDLLVLDPGLPGGDGFAVVAALRQSEARTTPLLVYSARELDAEQRDALTLGPTIHLTKSRSTPEELLSAVRELVALGRARRHPAGRS
jgi:PAS domain S-box-containing protein